MPMFQLGTMMPHKQREESIPSLNQTRRKRSFFAGLCTGALVSFALGALVRLIHLGVIERVRISYAKE
jgi:hypothetical protein